jgi:hypothetical protein
MKYLHILLLGIVFLILINVFSLANAAWANSSFDRCKNITISNAGSSTLSNYPALINVSYDSDMLSNYQDLRFYDTYCNNDGSTLDFEIENYTSSNANVWVRIPSLPATGTTISVYYKNNTVVGSGENKVGVWTNNYVSVLHFSETSDNYTDSSSFNNNANTVSVTTRLSVGKIGFAPTFVNTSSNSVSIPTHASLNLPNTGTVEFWIQRSDGYARLQAGVLRQTAYYFHPNADNTYRVRLYYGASSYSDTASSVMSDTNWHHMVLTWNSSQPVNQRTNIYVDGVLNKTGDVGGNIYASGQPVYIGSYYGTAARYLNGIVDEVHLVNTTLSSDWINQDYNMVVNQNTYVTWAEEESPTTTTTTTTTLPQEEEGIAVTISLNDSSVWWNDTVNASGFATYSSGNPISGTVSVTLDETVHSCPSTNAATGFWNCTFKAPAELGAFTALVTVTNSTGSSFTNSTTLNVLAGYGQIAVGTVDRVVFELPMIMQDLNGDITKVWARVKVWKG